MTDEELADAEAWMYDYFDRLEAEAEAAALLARTRSGVVVELDDYREDDQ